MSSLAAADYEYEAMAEYEALAEIVHQNFEWFYQFAEESERAGDYSNLIGLIVALVKWIETSYAVGYYLYKVIEPNVVYVWKSFAGGCESCYNAGIWENKVQPCLKEWKEWGIECLKSFGKGIWWCISTPFISGWNFFRWICEGIWNYVWTIVDNMFYDSALDKYRLTGRQVVFFCLGFVLLWCVYLLILAIVWFTRWRDGTLGNHDGGEAQDDGAQRRSRWGFRWWWKRRERKDDGADQDDGTAGGGGRNDPIHVPDNDSDSEDAEEDLQPTPQSERDLPKIDDKRGVPSRTMLKPRPGDSSLVLVRPPITKDMLCRDDIDNFYNDGVRDNLFPTYTQATSGTFGPEGMEDARAGALHANKVRQKFLNEWTTTTPQTPVTAYWLIHKHFNTTAVRASNFGNQPKLQANLGSRFNLHHQALHSILGTSEPVVENLKSTLGPYWKHARSYHFCIGEARNTNIQNKDRLRKKKRQKLADGRYKWV